MSSDGHSSDTVWSIIGINFLKTHLARYITMPKIFYTPGPNNSTCKMYSEEYQSWRVLYP